MIGLLSAGKNKKNISVRYLLLTFFVCISMVAWLGISDLRADADDPEDNNYEIKEGYQNNAQEQHVENIAKEAAFQDPEESNDESFYTDLIDKMRLEDGMGLGQIVHTLNRDYDLEIHPSVLGLGHSPVSSEEPVQLPMHSSIQSGKNHGQGLALGHSKENSNNRGGGKGGGKK